MGESLVKMNDSPGVARARLGQRLKQMPLTERLRGLCEDFFSHVDEEFMTLFSADELQSSGPEGGGPHDYFFLEVHQFHMVVGFNVVHVWVCDHDKWPFAIMQWWEQGGPMKKPDHGYKGYNAAAAAAAFELMNLMNVE